MACTEYYITAGDRDGVWDNSGNFDNIGVALGVVYSLAFVIAIDTFLVYTLNIPPGATIVSAYIRYRARIDNVGEVDSLIYAVLQPNPAIPANWADCENAPLTLNSVGWLTTAWTNGLWYVSPDISAVVQEVINQPGFMFGNRMIIQHRAENSLLIVGSNDAHSFDSDPASAPILCVEVKASNKGSIRIRDEIYYTSDIRDR